MSVDLKANAAYRTAKDKPFAVGQVVWVEGVQFRVVAVPSGQLILAPVTAKI